MRKIMICILGILLSIGISACGNPCKKGHTWEEATCTTPKECSVCNSLGGKALGHNVQEYTITKDATCVLEGEEQGVCERCNKKQSRKIEKKSHIEGEWKVTVEATATNDGKKQLYCADCGAVMRSETFTLTPEEVRNNFIQSCSSYSYKEIARNPDNYKGKRAKFQGEVVQVMESGNSCQYRVNITKGRYSWTDTIYVSYTRADSSEARILEDDIITIYGTLGGNYTYETVMGAEMTIPLIVAEYIDLN